MWTILKPTFLNTTLGFALLVITSLLWRSYLIATTFDIFPWGFPLQFYIAWGPCPSGETCSEFNVLWLVIDIAVWYVISVCIISALKRALPSAEKENIK